MDQTDKITILQDQINKVNLDIDAAKKYIVELEDEKKALMMELKYEKAVFTGIDILPEQIKELGIYIPEKYHIVRYLNYPSDCFVVGYNNYKFSMYGRIDMEHLYIFEINKINTNRVSITIPYIQIYLENNQNDNTFVLQNINRNNKHKMNDLPTAISRTKDVLTNEWSDDLAFGIAIFYFWLDIFYNKQHNKYINLYQLFVNSN